MRDEPRRVVHLERAPMCVVRAATNTSTVGVAEKFTGQVWVDALHPTDEASDAERADPGNHAYRVHFEPRARTHWHSHPRGQVLYVLSGRGRVGDENCVYEVLAGDTIHTAPGHSHWHGAAPDDFMVHLAISGAAETIWNGGVTDEQYGQAVSLEAGGMTVVGQSRSDRAYDRMRDTWADYDKRQAFEHDLINRKTTWLLTTQGLLFAAYGLTLDSANTAPQLDAFREIVAIAGLAIAAVVLIGVLALLNSKYMSWMAYRKYFEGTKPRELPRPLDQAPLQWGVRTPNTLLVLAPDVALPLLFVGLWVAVLAID